jgi:replicative DNA helicase
MELERDVLASLVVYGENALNVEAGLVTENDFIHDTYKEIFIGLKESKFCLSVYYSKCEDCMKHEFFAFLRELESRAVHVGEFMTVLTRLREVASRERIRAKLTEFTFGGVDFSVEDIRKLADDEEKYRDFSDILHESSKHVREYIDNFNTPSPKFSTGYGNIDYYLGGGVKTPSVFVIGARPSTGKTVFALNLALKFKQKATIFSLEMSAEMLLDRLISAHFGIGYVDVMARKLTAEQNTCAKKFAEWTNGNIDIFDTIYDIEQIAVAVRKMKPKIVVIDYVQIVGTSVRHKDEREKVTHVMREIRKIAKQNDCCVIVLSQISRSGKNAPTMSDLLESGAIEANADYVTLMHRPYVLEKGNPELSPEKLEIVLDKNRFGGTKKFAMRFDGACQRVLGVNNQH